MTASLSTMLDQRLPSAASSWLRERLAVVAAGASDRDLYLAFSMVPRKCGKADLQPTATEVQKLARTWPGGAVADLTVAQLARLLIVLTMPRADADDWCRRLDELFSTGEASELVALYRGLPLYPWPERHVSRAAEGVRSNMKAVFEAVAHGNPYPAAQLGEGAWNQMVLKCLFVGSRLHPVVGLDERANPRLTRMLCDYAHERWAASRSVSPELWRPVGGAPDEDALADLRRVCDTGTPMERRGAALALRGSDAGRTVLAGFPELAAATADLRWEHLVDELD